MRQYCTAAEGKEENNTACLNAGTEENIAPYEKVINNIKGICDKLSEEYPETKELYLETGVESFINIL